VRRPPRKRGLQRGRKRFLPGEEEVRGEAEGKREA